MTSESGSPGQPAPANAAPKLPYFDMLIPLLDAGNADVAAAFGRHVHWGYWPDPRLATREAANYAAAAERLTVEVYGGARIADSQSVLDVGCGFGGTIANLNERFDGMRLVGLNIDPRQLARARETATPRAGNQVEFVDGSASKLPFPDASFDAVLAVEAIFHFPDRTRFFAEAHRVLKPGGRLALSDFVPMQWMQPALWLNIATSYFTHYGNCDVTYSLQKYRSLAAGTGFQSVVERDITGNTMPTYAFLQALQSAVGSQSDAATIETRIICWMSWLRLLRYRILAFEKI